MSFNNKFFILLRKINTFLSLKGFFDFLSDISFIKMRYRLCIGKKIDLSNPKTFNEKLQWLKLYNRDPMQITMVDKRLAKDYVANIIGTEYVIPMLGFWHRAEDIDFDSLPNQFVLKCNHDSGGIVICRDKSLLDRDETVAKLKKALKRDPYKAAREWPYKNVDRCIIAEEYIEDSARHQLLDYKFFTFGGKVKALFIASDRQLKDVPTKFDFFDENFNHLPIINGHPNSHDLPQKPKNFDLMKVLAEKLSVGTPHLRVDFYEADGKVYFGELTFFHYGGLVPFYPEEWDETFGSWIELPDKNI